MISVEIRCAQTIEQTIKEAIALAGRIGCMVEFTFNGKFICVLENSDADEILREFYKFMRGIYGK